MNFIILLVTALFVLVLAFGAFLELLTSANATDPHIGAFKVLRGILEVLFAFLAAGIGVAAAQIFH